MGWTCREIRFRLICGVASCVYKMSCSLYVESPFYCSFSEDITLAMENCKYVVTALNNIAVLNSSGAIGKGQWEEVVKVYFLEDDRAMLALSGSENESDDEEIPDLGKNTFIEEDIVESSDDSDVEEMSVNSVVTEEVDRVLKSLGTQRAKQAVQTKRKRHRAFYLIKGVIVCHEAFIHVYG